MVWVRRQAAIDQLDASAIDKLAARRDSDEHRRATVLGDADGCGSLWFSWHVFPSDLLSTVMHKTNAVTVWIMDVHLAIAPTLISRFEINDNTCGLQFFVELIHIFDPEKDYSASDSITRKRGSMQFNVVAR